MDVKIHRSISELDQGQWDAIVSDDQIFRKYKYVETLEKSGLNKDRCYYPVVYEGGQIVAHASAYFVRTELDILAAEVIRNFIGLARQKWNNFFILRSLECGPPIALGSTLSFKPGADRAKAMRLLCREMEKLAKKLRINLLLFRDFYDHEKDLCKFLKECGYAKIHNLPKAQIWIRWKTFDEYLNSMRSNYRCKIVKSIEKCVKAGISIQVLKEFPKNKQDLKRLYDNVYDHAKEVKRDRLTEDFFHNLDRHLGKKTVIVTALKDEKLVGYMLLLVSGKTLISVFPGLDYDCSKECYIYFNLFYKTIELAIDMGMENIDMGITTLDPKKDMGSEIVNLNMYMKHFNPLLNGIIPKLFDMMTPVDTEGPRYVFKNSSSASQ